MADPRISVKKAYARWLSASQWQGKDTTAKLLCIGREITTLRQLVDEIEGLAQTLYKKVQEVETHGHNKNDIK